MVSGTFVKITNVSQVVHISAKYYRGLQDCGSGWESESAQGWCSCCGFDSTANTHTHTHITSEHMRLSMRHQALMLSTVTLPWTLICFDVLASVPVRLFLSQPRPSLTQRLLPPGPATRGASPEEQWTPSRSYDDTCQTEMRGKKVTTFTWTPVLRNEPN